MEDCIFCNIVKGKIPCFKIYEDEQVLAFADINPLSNGHTLVIPKAHAENLFEISDDDLTAVQTASKKIAAAIQTTLTVTGIAILQLNGKGVNQMVMHYHLHLLPREPDSPELAIAKWEIIPGNMETIEQISGEIAAAVK